jgi:Family of unknown function (DUF6152)
VGHRGVGDDQWDGEGIRLAESASALLVDVKNDKGVVETWAVEFHPPNVMNRGLGWTHNTFKPGDQVTIYGHPEKKSVPLVNGMKSLRPVKVTMASGQEVTVDPPGY